MHGSLIARVFSTARRAASPSLLAWILAGLLAATPRSDEPGSRAGPRGRFSPDQQRSLQEQFREAELQGIPVALLLPRLEEGIAKKVPPARLQEALRRQADLLLKARALLVGAPGGDALLADAAAWARTANLLSGALPAAEVRLLAGRAALRPRRSPGGPRLPRVLSLSAGRQRGFPVPGSAPAREARPRGGLP